MSNWSPSTKKYAAQSVDYPYSTVGNCPYQYGYGTDVLHRIDELPVVTTKGSAWKNILYLIVGSGQLYNRSTDYPFQTFCYDDAKAIRSDWDSVRRDLWSGVVKVTAKRPELKTSVSTHPTEISSQQLDLFKYE